MTFYQENIIYVQHLSIFRRDLQGIVRQYKNNVRNPQGNISLYSLKSDIFYYNKLKMNLEKLASPKNIIKKIFSFGSPRNSPLQSGEDSIKEKNIVVNVTLMGADCSGKSVFLNKDIEDKFEIMEPTLGVTFSTKKLNIGNLEIELKIWDTNGHEKYRPAIPVYITNDQTPKMCIIFYDVADRKSFEAVEIFYTIWKQKVSSLPEKDSVMIVANKIDSDFVGESHVTLEEGLEIARIYDAVFVQSSSLFDVSHVFNKLVEFKLSQLGLKIPFPQKQEKNGIQNGHTLKTYSLQKLAPEKKSKLTNLLISLQNLRSKVLACKFNTVSNKYLKIIQLKILWQQKMSTLHTTQFSLRKLKLQTLTAGSYCFEQNKKRISILEKIKNTQLTQIKKIQKIIVSYLPKQGESAAQIEQLKQIKKLYQKYLELWFSARELLNKSEFQQNQETMKTLQVLIQTFITYIDNLDLATKELQEKAYKNIQESICEINEEQLIKDLINCFILSKCQVSQDQTLSSFKPTENKQETNILLLNMVKKDQKFIEENLPCISDHLKKVREVLYKIVTYDPERETIEKEIQEHNKSIIQKQWRAAKSQARK